MKEVEIGKVEDYYNQIGVVAIEVTGDHVAVGDTVHFHGHTTDFTQTVNSMQIGHNPVQEAHKGDEIGIKVRERVRNHDRVFRVDA